MSKQNRNSQRSGHIQSYQYANNYNYWEYTYSNFYYFFWGSAWYIVRAFSITIKVSTAILWFFIFHIIVSYAIGYGVLSLLNVNYDVMVKTFGYAYHLMITFCGFVIYLVLQKPINYLVDKLEEMMKKESFIDIAIKKGKEISDD